MRSAFTPSGKRKAAAAAGDLWHSTTRLAHHTVSVLHWEYTDSMCKYASIWNTADDFKMSGDGLGRENALSFFIMPLAEE